MTEHTGADARAKIIEILKDLHVGMMVTRHDDGSMHARPMATNHADFDGYLWYLTDKSTEKVSDIKRHDEVMVAYADSDKHRYVSVTGTAELRTDRDAIRKAWAEPARVWFPKGIDDPNLVAIRVKVAHAEYWDSKASLMVLAYGYARALLTGKKLDEQGDTGRARF